MSAVGVDNTLFKNVFAAILYGPEHFGTEPE